MPGSVVSQRGPLLAALVCLWVAAVAVFAIGLERTGGRFVYALDDTYIHMALSRSLAEHGVWGIDGREFAPCSSSPLWTVVLGTAFRAFGVHSALPAILALACASGVLVVSERWLVRFGVVASARLAILVGIALATPLVTLVFVANEHALHTLLVLGLVCSGVRVMAHARPGPGAALLLASLAGLAVASRYESVIAVALVVTLLALRGLRVPAVVTALGGLVPVAVFGAWSSAHGGYFLPNSVLLKAKYPWLDVHGKIVAYLGPSAVSEAFKTPELALLVLGASLLALERLRRTRRLWEPATLLAVVFVGTALGHMDFARTGEFFRYEAYLIALGVFSTGLALADRVLWNRRTRSVLLAALILVPLAVRSVRALRDTPQASTNIEGQQIQIAEFFREHYAGQTVAVNDIGAVGFLGAVQVVDLWGLANREVAEARRRREYGPQAIRRVVNAEHADVAVVYERWFARFGGLPREWIRVEQWTIPDNVVCGSPTVSFFATRPAARERLDASLRAFAGRLPERVRRSRMAAE